MMMSLLHPVESFIRPPPATTSPAYHPNAFITPTSPSSTKRSHPLPGFVGERALGVMAAKKNRNRKNDQDSPVRSEAAAAQDKEEGEKDEDTAAALSKLAEGDGTDR